MLQEKIEEQFKAARLSNNDIQKAALTTLKAALLTAEKSVGRADNSAPLTEQEVIDVVGKTVKQYNESLLAFQTVNRLDKTASIASEMDVLKAYLPTLMTDDEIRAALITLKDQAEGNKGKLMGLFNKEYPKKADNMRVKDIVAEILP
jgi:uncharacterized protein YqeY